MHPKQAELERRLRTVFDELDSFLENEYGELFSLHPNRLPRGEAASSLYDGLFSASSKFTMGYGSSAGRGYSVVIDISTLDRVSSEQRKIIEESASQKLEALLQEHFPERELHVVKDHATYKVVGDFSLGDV